MLVYLLVASFLAAGEYTCEVEFRPSRDGEDISAALEVASKELHREKVTLNVMQASRCTDGRIIVWFRNDEDLFSPWIATRIEGVWNFALHKDG